MAEARRSGGRSWVTRLTPQLLSLLLLLALCAAYLRPAAIGIADFKDRLRNLAFDTLQRLQPRDYKFAKVWVLDIDEKSLSRYGQWPWPRDLLASILGKLAEYDIAAIGFDMVLAEPDRTSPARALAPYADKLGIADKLEALPDHDTLFAATLRQVPAVMGFALTVNETAHDPVHKATVAFRGTDARPFMPWKKGAVAGLEAFQQAAQGNGNFGFEADQDGVIRRVHLFWRYGKDGEPSTASVYPSLVAESLRVAVGARGFLVDAVGGEAAAQRGVAPGILGTKIGDFTIPTDGTGALWIHFTPSQADRFVSVATLMDGKIDPELAKGSVVLLGTSATGLQDLRFSPLGEIVPGVEVHAQALEQILLGEFLARPDWAESLELLAMVVVSLLLIVLVGPLGALWTAIAGGAAVMASLGAVWWGFSVQHVLTAPIFPWVTVTAVYLVATGIRFVQTERESRFIRGAFASYVSPNLVKHLIDHPEQLKLGGERRECTFVLTDLAGFTTLVERSEPEAIVGLLNDYIEGMTQVAFKHEGTLDRIVGDAVAVMFSAPVVQADHAARAISCAMEMDAFSQAFQKRQVEGGRKVGHTRIGVHSGTVIIGNVGGGNVFDYRALGDAINTTARLETVNRYLGTRICVSADAAKQDAAFVGRPIGSLVLKGKSQPIDALEPLPADRVASLEIQAYRAAYQLMEVGDPAARDAFAKLAGSDPLAAFHLARLERGETGTLVVMEEK